MYIIKFELNYSISFPKWAIPRVNVSSRRKLANIM